MLNMKLINISAWRLFWALGIMSLLLLRLPVITGAIIMLSCSVWTATWQYKLGYSSQRPITIDICSNEKLAEWHQDMSAQISYKISRIKRCHFFVQDTIYKANWTVHVKRMIWQKNN